MLKVYYISVPQKREIDAPVKILKNRELVSRSEPCNDYNTFGFEQPQNLHINKFKQLKEVTFKFRGSDRVVTKPSGVERKMHAQCQMIVSILRDVNSLLAAIEREVGVAGLHVEFSGIGCFMQLDSLFK